MRTAAILCASFLAACAATPKSAPPAEWPPVATFSAVGYDPETGDLGVAVQSKFFGVGSVVPWARAGVGAVATQAFANTTYGPEALDLLAAGKSPEEVIRALTGKDLGRDRRQVGVVDAQGRAASFTGSKAMAWAGHLSGKNWAVQGNILAGEEVVKAMAAVMENGHEPLPERLLAALSAGQAAGGDRRGMQSAALLVVRKGGGYAGFNDRYVDLRVEDHEKPIEELARLLKLHRTFYPDVPVPGALAGFSEEPPPPADAAFATPRAAFETFVARFAAGDWKALREAYCRAYRETHPLAAFEAEMAASAEQIRSFLEACRYAGTKVEGDVAWVALQNPGSPRPVLQRLLLEDGRWLLAD